MSSSFWRRHRRKIVAAAAVGAAGAAAAYWWYYGSEEEEAEQALRAAAAARRAAAAAARANLSPAQRRQQQQQQRQRQEGGGGGGGGVDAVDGADKNDDGEEYGQQQQQQPPPSLDDSLAAHFASIQELSDRQALEELLPRLHDLLLRATNYEPLRAQLRAPAAAGMSSEEKLALWRGLAGHSFARALAGAWLVPLLDLLVRLKLHIVGRHMYLESRLPQLQPRGAAALFGGVGGVGGGLFGGGGAGARGGPALAGLRAGAAGAFGRMALPPALSDRAKEEFFRCDYFIDAGAGGLLHKLRLAVDRALAGVDFGGSMRAGDVEALFAAVHAAFEEPFARAEDLWAAYLVPPGPAAALAPLRAAGAGLSGGVVEAPLSPVEAAMVDELNAELREVLGDARFVEALRAAVRHASRSMGAYVGGKMGGGAHHHHHHHHHHRGHQQQPGEQGEQQQDGEQQLQQQQQQGQQGQQEQPQGPEGHLPAAPPPPPPRPFPYVVPIVAKSGQLLFDEAGRCSRGISGLREVQALCAAVFTWGPNVC